ncbi:hypothetical protein ACFWHQ_06575 [Streptomyces sp. NPDC060334]|nr:MULTISPECIES: hypothetical protein [unclassified Streptomyces]MCX5075243.1 hypothetical protein [Streptomyces sp. NBC_00424]WUD41628.1 hypothetical protein OHA84_14525 [Streptomyces sp. NBC_00513]
MSIPMGKRVVRSFPATRSPASLVVRSRVAAVFSRASAADRRYWSERPV